MSFVEAKPMECDVQEECEEDSDEEDSEGDEMEDDKNEEELRLKVNQLKKQIASNNLCYDGHVTLIATLRDLKELEEARNAREEMSKVYPLSPELWLEWLRDEQNVCTSSEERQYIKTLFDRAVKDYTSVQVWVEYVMFMIGSGNMDETRAVAERALTAVGTHVAEGILVWQVVLLVEKQMYASMKKPDGTESEEERKAVEKQLRRIQSFYRRQVRVPLLNVDPQALLVEASEYFEGNLDPHISLDIEKAQKKLSEKILYEEELLKCEKDTDKLAVYRRYITHTREADNPAAVQNLYERAVTDHCLDTGIWEEYVQFAIRQFQGLDYVVLPICERSQRNCPWSATLCELYIRALQLFATEVDKNLSSKIKGVLEKGLGCGLQSGSEATRMWMSYLVYLRRLIKWDQSRDSELDGFRVACQQSIDMIDSSFGVEGDIDSEIPRFWARIEGEFGKNNEKVREIWNDIIMKRNENYKKVNLWLEFINLERSYGTEKHCRKLFRRALERVWDNVELIGDAYLRYEQEAGTVESMEDFLRRYEERMVIVKRKRAEDDEKLGAERQANETKYGKQKNKGTQQDKRKSNFNKQANGHSQDSNVFKAPFQVSKQDKDSKQQRRHPQHENVIVQNAPETPRMSESIHQPTVITKDKGVPPGFKSDITPPPGFKSDVTPPPGFNDDGAAPPGFSGDKSSSGLKRKIDKSEDEPTAKIAKISELYGVPAQKDACDDLSTVFVSNLNFSVGKEEVVSLFSGCGEIKDFRLVLDFKQRSKGFGYLVFKSQEAVAKAIKLDRIPMNGRPVFVSKYDPEGHTRNFKYTMDMEKNKLFVRGLPYSMKDDDIREEFQPHGDIKEIRLVIYKNGLSKGTCYIEYHDEETAEKVRQAMNGKELQGKVITVLISNPPKNKGASATPIASLGSGSQGKKVMGGRGKGMFDLMPRSLMRASSSAPATSSDSTTSTTEGQTKPKTNEDFRKMLLKK